MRTLKLGHAVVPRIVIANFFNSVPAKSIRGRDHPAKPARIDERQRIVHHVAEAIVDLSSRWIWNGRVW